MAITMIDQVEVASKEFEQSHLFNKLQKMVVVARVFQSQSDNYSLVHSVASFDLDNPEIYEQVKADYDLVRETIRTQGFSNLSGKMGKLVQPRTKGQGLVVQKTPETLMDKGFSIRHRSWDFLGN